MSLAWETIYMDLPTGFQTPTIERDRIDAVGGVGAGIYGEVTAASARRILQWLEPTADDLLLDLGSGTGRFLVQAVCETAIGSVVGIEMAPHRHGVAERARHRLADLDPATADRISLHCADLTTVAWPPATIVWAGATCFSDALTATIARRADELPCLRHLLLTRPIPAPGDARWREVGHLDLPMSWTDRVGVHIYARRT